MSEKLIDYVPASALLEAQLEKVGQLDAVSQRAAKTVEAGDANGELGFVLTSILEGVAAVTKATVMLCAIADDSMKDLLSQDAQISDELQAFAKAVGGR